jgi:hypothetical protein
LPGEERPDLRTEGLTDRPEVERGQRRVGLDKEVGDHADLQRQRAEADDIAVHPAEKPWRVVLLEVTDRGERVLRGELHPPGRRGDELDRDLRLQRPVPACAGIRARRTRHELPPGADVDLAGGGALLHRAEAADRLAELAPVLRVLDGHLVREHMRRGTSRVQVFDPVFLAARDGGQDPELPGGDLGRELVIRAEDPGRDEPVKHGQRAGRPTQLTDRGQGRVQGVVPAEAEPALARARGPHAGQVRARALAGRPQWRAVTPATDSPNAATSSTVIRTSMYRTMALIVDTGTPRGEVGRPIDLAERESA